jgi:two-component system sensor histidine kinase EvgS
MYTQQNQGQQKKVLIYILYVTVSTAFTIVLNIIHSTYVLKLPLVPMSFLIPVSAGFAFGLTLAHNKALSSRMQEMAYTDSLTQVYNRLHMTHFLEAEIERARRYQSTFSLILFDLDYFKKINDEHGHQAGDKVLQQVAKLVSNANRDADILARYGGEEFLILASATNIDGAVKHAERLRRDIAQHKFSIPLKVTASFGVAEFDPEDDDINSLIRRTDIALYNAKARGRNCVAQA